MRRHTRPHRPIGAGHTRRGRHEAAVAAAHHRRLPGQSREQISEGNCSATGCRRPLDTAAQVAAQHHDTRAAREHHIGGEGRRQHRAVRHEADGLHHGPDRTCVNSVLGGDARTEAVEGGRLEVLFWQAAV